MFRLNHATLRDAQPHKRTQCGEVLPPADDKRIRNSPLELAAGINGSRYNGSIVAQHGASGSGCLSLWGRLVFSFS